MAPTTMNVKRKSSTPTFYSTPGDLSVLLDELDQQADDVLVNACILHDKSQKIAVATDDNVRCNYAAVLCEHVAALEIALGIIRLNAGLITDEHLEAWANDGPDAVKCEGRTKMLDDLMTKLQQLKVAISELRSDMVGEDDGLL